MTNDEQRKAPVLRFKGFHDDWEQRKLGTIIYQQKIKNVNNKTYPTYSISNKYGFIPQEEQFGKDNTYSKVEKNNHYIVKPKSFAYNPARINVGSIGYWDQNFPVIVSSLYEVFKTDKDKVNDKYLEFWYKTSLFKKQVYQLEEGGVRQYFFFDKMQKTKIYLSKIEEQSKISNLFKILERLISLQQRKNILLKSLKNTISKNLFNRKDSKLFLKKDNRDWKIYTLKNLGHCVSGYGFPNSEQGGKKGIPFYKVSDFNLPQNNDILQKANNYVTTEQIRKEKWHVINKTPAILFAKVGAAIFLNRKRISNSSFLMDNNLMAFKIKKDKLDTTFAKFLFENIFLPKYAQTGALPSYNTKDIENIRVSIPQFSTQKNIGILMKKLDLNVYINNRIQDENKKIKKFLLQNMFI